VTGSYEHRNKPSVSVEGREFLVGEWLLP